MSIHELQRPGHPAPPPVAGAGAGAALWRLGFRPFYLLASAFAVLSVGLWALQYSGTLGHAYLNGPLWHAHEMLFGYTVAVIAGFLLTAVRNWTNQPTPTGFPLMALAALWLAGRVLVLTPWNVAAALVNAAFPFAVAVAIGIPIVRAGNTRNTFFVGLLALLGVLTLLVHATLAGVIDVAPRFGLQLALDVVLFIMVVMAGRVVPMFTNNGVPGAGARRQPWVERAALGSVLLLFVADAVPGVPMLAGVVALFAALAHAARLALWQPWRTLQSPLVWVLHVAYAWIVVHLLLRGLAGAGVLADSFAVHALTVGAIGSLTLGMITRTARGHTGRPLQADGFETAAYGLVTAAAIARVFGTMAFPAAHLAFVQISAILWAAGFGLYVVRYWPILSRPRLDGRPG